MFVVRYTYLGKADKYVRMHSNSSLTGGGAFHDVLNVFREYRPYDGYHYASKAFILYKTTNYMVHKDAVPDSIREKLGID